MAGAGVETGEVEPGASRERHSFHSHVCTRTPLIVVSPHLDDAVLSCGTLLSTRHGSLVVTVFAGAPREPGTLTEWDERCGFSSAGTALATRRAEDSEAVGYLGGESRWLDFSDAQYGEINAFHAIAAALGAVFDERPDHAVLFPLGLFHSDHVLTHRAAACALRSRGARRLFVYEDVPYRHIEGELAKRFRALRSVGLQMQALAWDCDAEHRRHKARAIAAYASQLRVFGPHGPPDAARPERYWVLESSASHA